MIDKSYYIRKLLNDKNKKKYINSTVFNYIKNI
jgi:hypothetical protein